MSEPRPAIERSIKRAVRQRCGFGCVICGLPIYTYEHMEGWANVKRHKVDEITLLCDRHQRERTGRLLPIEKVHAADKNPRNLRIGETPTVDLHFDQSSFEYVIGSNRFRSEHNPGLSSVTAIAVDDRSLLAFSFEDEHLFLSVDIYDRSDQRILWIDRNELVYSARAWDIEWVGQLLRIREGHKRILFEVRFIPPSRVEVRRGYLRYNGYEFVVHPKRLYYLNQAASIHDCEFQFLETAISAGAQDRPNTGLHFPGINRNFEKTSREDIVAQYRRREEMVRFSEDHWASIRTPTRRPKSLPETRENVLYEELPPDMKDATQHRFYFGESDTCLSKLGSNVGSVFDVLDQPLAMRQENGKLFASLTLRDDDGNIVAQMVDNEWTENAGNKCDRNFDNELVEVLDAKGRIVLQARIDGGAIRFQFKLFGIQNDCLAIWSESDDGQIIGRAEHAFTSAQYATTPKFTRLFNYPSDLHLGERDKSGFSPLLITSNRPKMELIEREEWPFSIHKINRERHKEFFEYFPLGYAIVGREGCVHFIAARSQNEKSKFELVADWNNTRIEFVPFGEELTVVIPSFKLDTDSISLAKVRIDQDLPFVEGSAWRPFHMFDEPTMYFHVLSAEPFHPVVLMGFRLSE